MCRRPPRGGRESSASRRVIMLEVHDGLQTERGTQGADTDDQVRVHRHAPGAREPGVGRDPGHRGWRPRELASDAAPAEVDRPDRAPDRLEFVYTFGSPAFVQSGEIYRVHSGSRLRAATHPDPHDLVPGRKHVYAARPLAMARAR